MSNNGAGGFLPALASTLRAFGLYPEGHPIPEEKINELVKATEAAMYSAEGPKPIDYIIHDDSFFFGDRLLSKESITLQWMMRQWQTVGIHSVTISPGAGRAHLAALVLHISGKSPPPDGVVRINVARLLTKEEAPAEGETLRSLYADTLDLTREIGQGMISGAQPSLGAAKETVERLVTAVMGDKESALLLSTMHTHDEQTFFHMVNVCILSVATGSAIGLSRDQLSVLGMGGLLHDIGKVGVSPEVLNRSGPLSDEDWDQIRRHPLEGAGMLLRSWERISPLAAKVAYEHHVRLDGRGYPPDPIAARPDLMSRIVTVTDTFDAMTSRRPYRRAEQRQRALEVLLSGAGSHYDGRVVRVFIRLMGFYPPGSVVKLEDDSIAVVVQNNPNALDSPVIQVVKDPAGNELSTPEKIDLAAKSNGTHRIAVGVDQLQVGVDPADLI